MSNMKKMKRVMILLIVFAMGLCMQISAGAASSTNPLAKMQTKSSVIVTAPRGTGCNFFTPEYTSDFKMTATSSNPKVATVKVYNFHRGNKYSKGYYITRKGYGTTNIKVTVKIGKKTYTKTCKYSFYRYTNPLSEFKMGKTNYASKIKNGDLKLDRSKLSGKISIKPKKGYKILNLQCQYGDGRNIRTKVIKNNSKLPSKTSAIFLKIENTKTKANCTIWVKCPDNQVKWTW